MNTHCFEYFTNFMTVKQVFSFNSAGATIPPVNGKTWDFLCPTGNAPAGAPCPTALTGHIFICNVISSHLLLKTGVC